MEVGGQLHTPAAHPPLVRALGTHWTRGFVGPKAGLNAVARRKISSLPLSGIEPKSFRP